MGLRYDFFYFKKLWILHISKYLWSYIHKIIFTESFFILKIVWVVRQNMESIKVFIKIIDEIRKNIVKILRYATAFLPSLLLLDTVIIKITYNNNALYIVV